MARGIIAGALWGVVVSGLGASVISLSVERPVGHSEAGMSQESGQSQTAETEAVQPSEATVSAQPPQEEASTTTAAAAPRADVSEPDDLAPMSAQSTQTAAQPSAGTSDTTMNAPASSDTSAVAMAGETPVTANTQVAAPKVPAAEAELSISTDPAQPAAPEAGNDTSAFPSEDVAEVSGEATVETTSETTVPNDVSAQQDVPATMTPQEDTAGEAAPVVVAAVEPEQPVQPVVPSESTETPSEDAAPKVDTQTAEPVAEPEAGSEPAAEPEEELVIVVAPEAEEETTRPKIGKPASRLGSSSSGGLATTVGGATPRIQLGAQVAENGTEAEASPQVSADAASLPPIQRYAKAFENTDKKPLMAIVLIDDGTSKIDYAALASFPYPLSFAVDTASPKAAEIMQKYRAAGQEVLALANLPAGASASDTEVAFSVLLEAVPEAVGVMEGDGTGLQSSREMSDQLAEIMRDSGHGLLLFPKGLNTAQKLAKREGVPAATVFRDFDSKGQNAGVIRRFLDQAAFKASQEEGGVVMVGRLRADTVSALLLWGLQDRARRVALAPVSAVLTAK